MAGINSDFKTNVLIIFYLYQQKFGLKQWSAVELRNYAVLEGLRNLVQTFRRFNICHVRAKELKMLSGQ